MEPRAKDRGLAAIGALTSTQYRDDRDLEIAATEAGVAVFAGLIYVFAAVEAQAIAAWALPTPSAISTTGTTLTSFQNVNFATKDCTTFGSSASTLT